jgi:hypothetical protein
MLCQTQNLSLARAFAESVVGTAPYSPSSAPKPWRNPSRNLRFCMEVEVLLDKPARERPPKDNIRRHTPARLNRMIDQAMMKRVIEYSRKSPEEITERIQELDQEWDLERFVETGAGTVALTGVLMSGLKSRKWLVVSAATLGVLLQHSLTRRSFPIKGLRALGIRTRREIEGEKYALRVLRGDFDSLKGVSEESHRAIEALRLSRP